MSSYTGMEECEKTNTTTKRKIFFVAMLCVLVNTVQHLFITMLYIMASTAKHQLALTDAPGRTGLGEVLVHLLHQADILPTSTHFSLTSIYHK